MGEVGCKQQLVSLGKRLFRSRLLVAGIHRGTNESFRCEAQDIDKCGLVIQRKSKLQPRTRI